MDASARPGWFGVRMAHDGDVVSVIVSGDADLPHRHELEAALCRAAERSPAVVILDLRAVPFMDASGLRAVLAAQARSEKDGWTLIVLRGSPAVDLIFEVTGTEERLHLVRERPPDSES